MRALLDTPVCLIILPLVFASCSLSGANLQRESNPAVHSDCRDCHTVARPEGKTALFPSYTDPSYFCLDCHNYKTNHHPVNFIPARQIRPQFPLSTGEITCLTCHEMHGGPQHKGTPKLLRGGPYADLRTMCLNCHTVEQYANIDPHIMKKDGEERTVVGGKTVCLFCHELEPDPAQDRANMVLFKADVTFLCLRCHTLMHTGYFEKHFLVTPSKEIISNSNRPEILARFSLPLVPRGRITCTTCHNPHQGGSLPMGLQPQEQIPPTGSGTGTFASDAIRRTSFTGSNPPPP
ncbi:cytochrome c3 family protein [Geobacter sp. FeAm09]|uniref:cytochrome c3 family protein n=1 Tax=Geobacter sp. FeAm09 TaxID=2597769 RepID=UPI00143D25BA|nr:cytochrome c3 family protein [Geobacter sp. FeAm09]